MLALPFCPHSDTHNNLPGLSLPLQVSLPSGLALSLSQIHTIISARSNGLSTCPQLCSLFLQQGKDPDPIRARTLPPSTQDPLECCESHERVQITTISFIVSLVAINLQFIHAIRILRLLFKGCIGHYLGAFDESQMAVSGSSFLKTRSCDPVTLYRSKVDPELD